MRPLEALLVAALVASLFMRWLQPRNRQVTATLLAMIGILVALHLVFDGGRWEMIPAYAMALAAVMILARDLRRVSGARAGESSQWIALPSTAQRVTWGALLAIAALSAVVIPAWAFPRIVLPVPDGLYDIGRMDVTFTDPARGNRPIDVAIWYPAEQPNGRVLRYHPAPAALGSGLANGTPMPGFTFRNLTAARTHSTREPRFSIREGRSPLVLASHDSGGHRFEGTALFERLASNGYVVASVGSDGSADAEVFDIPARAGDLSFVLNHLVQLPAGGAADTLATHIRVDRIALIGRGLGAAAALELGATEPRVTAVAAVAPRGLTGPARAGVRRPFLVFTVGATPDGLEDAMRYGGTEARLEGATEPTLSDRALVGAPIASVLGIESGDSPQDVHAAVSALTLRFLDQYLKERREQTEVDLPSRVRVQIIPHPARAG
jgi:predicted dienelactone hydrolase